MRSEKRLFVPTTTENCKCVQLSNCLPFTFCHYLKQSFVTTFRNLVRNPLYVTISFCVCLLCFQQYTGRIQIKLLWRLHHFQSQYWALFRNIFKFWIKSCVDNHIMNILKIFDKKCDNCSYIQFWSFTMEQIHHRLVKQ